MTLSHRQSADPAPAPASNPGEPERASPAFDEPPASDTLFFLDKFSRELHFLEPWLFGTWLMVALILLVRKILVYQNFLSVLKTGSTQVSDIEILNLLAHCEERLNLKGNVELCTNPMIGSPIMVGFFHPFILLPSKETPEKLYYIFTHELIHFKRRDMFYKWFVQLVLCVHWFNPFVYRLAKETNSACELACDEAVAANLNDTEKGAYGDTLLAFLRTDNTCKNSAPYVTLAEGAKDLKERLGAIMKSKKKSKRMTCITAMVTFIICISFTTLGAYAKPGENTPSKDNSISSEPKNTSANNTSDSSDDSVSCEYDNGIYYIYVNGADLNNKPLVEFTDGTIGITLVQKDSYTSLGPFEVADTDSFREQLT